MPEADLRSNCHPNAVQGIKTHGSHEVDFDAEVCGGDESRSEREDSPLSRKVKCSCKTIEKGRSLPADQKTKIVCAVVTELKTTQAWSKSYELKNSPYWVTR